MGRDRKREEMDTKDFFWTWPPTVFFPFCQTQGWGQLKLSAQTNRATRFGEFQPIGQLFTFGSFLKITEVCSPTNKGLYSIWHKNGLGNFLGDFFTNPSAEGPDEFFKSGQKTCVTSVFYETLPKVCKHLPKWRKFTQSGHPAHLVTLQTARAKIWAESLKKPIIK
jgi:hypothetical protein